MLCEKAKRSMDYSCLNMHFKISYLAKVILRHCMCSVKNSFI